MRARGVSRGALVGTLVGTLALAACSSPTTLDSADVETGIATALTEQVGGQFTVTCPSAVEAAAGQTFDCSVVDVTTGSTRTVRVEQTDSAGGYSWRMVPSTAPSGDPTG